MFNYIGKIYYLQFALIIKSFISEIGRFNIRKFIKHTLYFLKKIYVQNYQ